MKVYEIWDLLPISSNLCIKQRYSAEVPSQICAYHALSGNLALEWQIAVKNTFSSNFACFRDQKNRLDSFWRQVWGCKGQNSSIHFLSRGYRFHPSCSDHSRYRQLCSAAGYTGFWLPKRRFLRAGRFGDATVLGSALQEGLQSSGCPFSSPWAVTAHTSCNTCLPS